MRCLHGPENQEAGSFSSYSMTKPGRERGRKRQRNAFGGKQGFQRKKGMLAEVSGMPAPESRAPASQGRVPATNCRRLRAGRCDRVYVPTNASRDPQLGHGGVRVPSRTEASVSPGSGAAQAISVDLRAGSIQGPGQATAHAQEARRLYYPGSWSPGCSRPVFSRRPCRGRMCFSRRCFSRTGQKGKSHLLPIPH